MFVIQSLQPVKSTAFTEVWKKLRILRDTITPGPPDTVAEDIKIEDTNLQVYEIFLIRTQFSHSVWIWSLCGNF